MSRLEEPEDELIEFDPEELEDEDDEETQVNSIIRNKSYIYDPDPEADIEYEPDPRRRRRARRGRRLRRYFRRPRRYIRYARRKLARVRRHRFTVNKAIGQISPVIGLVGGLLLPFTQPTFREKLNQWWYHVLHIKAPTMDALIWRLTDPQSTFVPPIALGAGLTVGAYLMKVFRVKRLGWLRTLMMGLGIPIIIGVMITALITGSPAYMHPPEERTYRSNTNEGSWS